MPLPVRKPILSFSKRGFTIVEVVVALGIIMVGLLGMLQAINISIQANLQNEMRTQGVMVAEDQLGRIKSLPFDSITASGEKNLTVPVTMRSVLMSFNVTKKVDDISATTKRVNVGVNWKNKGNKYEHVVSAVIAQPASR
jgi:type IV pilus assembly protein PilV